jgi:hypothetical protein
LKYSNGYNLKNIASIKNIYMNKSFSVSIKASLFTAAIVFFVLSCKSKSESAAENSPPQADDKQQQKATSPNIPKDMENILGEWTLVKKLRDDNGNHKIDEEEEKAMIESKNYMKLNNDGTCKYETIMDGRYEIITEEDGRKRLAFYDMSGTKYPMNLYINSVNKDELLININYGGGSQFEIYKRP